ncbi:histidine kinase N-terminal 7TM domain-containing protein [Mariniphaga sp.]|uniref:histidine kinase N-terminal 7TM domain-containing protein n=1 Tax=Mariniphaga sp. TaxID=1954475 RepID=UPI003569BE0D
MLGTFIHISFDTIPKVSIIEFLAVIVALGTVSILWRYKKSKEVMYLIYIEIFAAIWALACGLEFLADDLETKKFWSQLSYLGFSFLPLFYFLFTTAFSQKYHIITPRNLALLSVIPFVTVPLALTNEYHNLVWKNVYLNSESNMTIIEHGIWFWIFWSYSITLIFAGLYNLFRSIYEFTAYYRSQVSTLLIATLIPLVGNLMYITGLNPIPGFDWTPVLFVFTGLVITFGIVKYRMFDLVPFARNKLIDTMSDGVIVINSEGFIEDYNPAVARIFKFQSKSMVRKRFAAVFAPYAKLIEASNEKKANLIEIETIENDLKNYYQIRITPVYDRNQKFSGQLLQINEITSLKETEQKLKDEIEERGRLIDDLDSFAHTVAHDLRNSLGSVYSSSEIIEASIAEGNTETIHEFAEMIKTASQKAMQITHELLILATVSHHEIERKPLDMKQIFNGAKKQIKDLILNKNAQISVPEKWPVATGYASWVEEIWVNYLTNAIKYGGSPPKLEIRAENSASDSVRFWIKDNGNGIAPENQSKLFRKYVRLVPEKADGYGLGLSIVKRIVEKLGGSVGVESSGIKGEGALFWFELPRN